MKNRRLLKLALAALLIALPLILSGCYVTPDIPASNPKDPLNFPTYHAPATNPPVQTPVPSPQGNDPFGGMKPLPSSNPGGTIGSWTGTVGPMPTIPRMTAPVVSKPPYTATPAPTPAGSLKLGSSGPEVRNLQRRLRELGFLKGSADGDFGEATEKAVKAFQKQYGLTVDGKVGPATQAKLATARHTARPAATPTRRPTEKPVVNPNTYLKQGSSGSKVREMQIRLIELGYLSGEATGNFGPATEAAVIAFQKRNCDYWDGIAGPETLKKLYSSSARRASSSSGIVGNSLKVGSTGSAVRDMQRRLKELGYYHGSVDGDFGAGTEDAVRAFQRAHRLTVDGKAGEDTLAMLYSSNAKRASAANATKTPRPLPTRRPTPTPRRTPTPLPQGVYVHVTPGPDPVNVTLRRGYEGSPVTKMQKELKAQGYYSGDCDGMFGEGTENAVKAFQRVNGLNVDGVAGPATLRVLYEGDFPVGS